MLVQGSGSTRLSPRSRMLAAKLRQAGLATLLLDLLTTEEEAIDLETSGFRFDIDLLAMRMIAATDWVRAHPETSHLELGYFGASTGAAAALIAAAHHPDRIAAVVCRSGRPDLAIEDLPKVRAATLLIVGELDTSAVKLNQSAYEHLFCPRKLEIIAGAGHLFEEEEALERVAALAAAWFALHLEPAAAVH
jgi:pimeloyl-ACP methyl ester carboxylesterase